MRATKKQLEDALLAIYEIVKGPLPWTANEVNKHRSEIASIVVRNVTLTNPPGPHRLVGLNFRRSF